MLSVSTWPGLLYYIKKLLFIFIICIQFSIYFHCILLASASPRIVSTGSYSEFASDTYECLRNVRTEPGEFGAQGLLLDTDQEALDRDQEAIDRVSFFLLCGWL